MKTYDVELDGQVYRCRPTFRAIAAIEGTLGKSVYKVGTEMVSADLQVRELVVVLQQMIGTSGSPIPAAEVVGNAIMAVGSRAFVEAAAQFCLSAFSGPKTFDAPEVTTPLARTDGQPIN